MKNSFLKAFSISAMFIVAFGVAIHVVTDNTKEVEKASAYSTTSLPTTIDLNDTSASNIRSYYSTLNSLSTSERRGTNLLKNLKSILKSGQQYLSYDSGNAIWDVYCIVDRDWTKSPASALPAAAGTYNSSTNKITGYKWGGNSSTYENPYLHALYYNRDQTPVARAYGDHGNNTNTGINREHIWPKGAGFDSSGAGGARGDIMHLWAAHGHTNNKHSNYYYGYVDKTKTYKDEASDFSICAGNLLGYSKSLGGSTNVFEPQDSDKGDIARACFYMVARYNYLSGSDSDGIDANNPNLELVNNITSFSSSGYTSGTSTTGKLGIIQDLLEWNRLDPPDAWEIHRNNLCYNNFTKNRNPFIDFPEWAEFIWGKSENGSYSSTSTGYATPSTDEINDFSSGGGGGGGQEDPILSSIAVSNAKTSYTVGDTFVKPTVTATYSNASPAVVTDSCTFSGYDMSTTGNQTVTVSYTEGGVNKTTTYGITVSSVAPVSSDAALYSGAITEGDYVIYYNGKAMKNTVTGNRFDYTEVTPTNNKISSPDSSILWHIAPSGNYWTIYNSSVAKYAGGTTTKNQGGLLDSITDYAKWTVTGTSTYDFENKGRAEGSSDTGNKYLRNNGTYGFACYSTSTGGALSLYKLESATPTPTLSSITLDTSLVQTEFTVGDTFNYDNIVVTAHYSDSTSGVVTPTSVSSPDMSTSGQKTITVTYQTESETYTINVSEPIATSITATVSKTYYVGETITKSDICVEDNLGNEINDFSFANNNYQFTYTDAASGGGATNKTFTNSITANELTCSLTVQVSRKQRQNLSSATDVIDLAYTERSGTTYGSWSGKAGSSSSAYYAGNNAGGNSSIQLRSGTSSGSDVHAGIVSTTSGGLLASVSVVWNSNTPNGRALTVYGKNTAYSNPNDLYDVSTRGDLLGTITNGTSTSITIEGNYTYIGLCDLGNAIYIDEIDITYQGDTATNVANYIMYEDTNGQCNSKFGTAKTYFEGMTKEERRTFMEDNDDYVIVTARTRFEAWATHLNKTITYSGGDYVINANTSSFSKIVSLNDDNAALAIVITLFSITLIGAGIMFVKRRKLS